MSKKRNTIKDLYLDRPTSHGGWPGGHSGSYRDPNTPVNKQIEKFLKDLGLLDDENPRARLSEGVVPVKRVVLEGLLRRVLIESSMYYSTNKSIEGYHQAINEIINNDPEFNLDVLPKKIKKQLLGIEKPDFTVIGNFYEDLYVAINNKS